jgi:hypothetical protein
VFRIAKDEVTVLAIIHREDVYRIVAKRG